MDDGVVPVVRKGDPLKSNLAELQETDMTKTNTSTLASIYRLAEVAGLAFMLSALPVAAVSFITQSA